MNNYETEFKFLIDRLPVECLKEAHKYYIKQTYFDGKRKINMLEKIFPSIDFNIINTYRIRYVESDNDKKIILTIKSGTLSNGLSRIEEERIIDSKMAENLIDNNDENTIIKYRYVDNYEGYKFEFDEYINLNKELFTVEIELDKDTDYKKEVSKIKEMIENHYHLNCSDVTFDHTYKNSNLLKYFGRKKE